MSVESGSASRRRRAAALFVTGTDTGVGKTVVAAGLVAAWRRRGVDAVGFKPVETGVPGLADITTTTSTHATEALMPWPAPGAMPGDGMWLAAAGAWQVALPEVVPWAFAAPLAPVVAAERAGVVLEPDSLLNAFEAVAARHELVVVEGAGGLAVGLTREYDSADFVRQLGLPLLVVCRPTLGTLNHTVLTVRYAQSKGIEPVGLIINGMPPPHDHAAAVAADPSLASNPQELEAQVGLPVLATIPRSPNPPPTPAAAADLIEAHLDLNALRVRL